MFRSTTILLVFLVSIFLTSSAVEAGIQDEDQKTADEMTESFILGLIDKAGGEERSPSEREEFIRIAKGLAESYTKKTGDRSFKKKIRLGIRSLPEHERAAKRALDSSDPDFYRKLVDKQQNTLDMDLLVKEFVTALIEKSLSNPPEEDERDIFKVAALDISRRYSGLKGTGAFLRKIENIMNSLPSGAFKTDEEILFTFQEAMRHQNTIVKEYIVKQIQPRIEEFVEALINEATSGITPEARREELLKTSMNITQTYAKLTGDNEFHRTNLKRVFTARLSARMISKAVKGIHTVNTSRRRDSETLIRENLFTPNNIVIQTGETVRWENNDTVVHDIRTIDFLSDGHFTAPEIKPDETFELSFTTPGDYYYISLKQKNMYGKITVVE